MRSGGGLSYYVRLTAVHEDGRCPKTTRSTCYVINDARAVIP